MLTIRELESDEGSTKNQISQLRKEKEYTRINEITIDTKVRKKNTKHIGWLGFGIFGGFKGMNVDEKTTYTNTKETRKKDIAYEDNQTCEVL